MRTLGVGPVCLGLLLKYTGVPSNVVALTMLRCIVVGRGIEAFVLVPCDRNMSPTSGSSGSKRLLKRNYVEGLGWERTLRLSRVCL